MDRVVPLEENTKIYPQQKSLKLTEIEVKDENTALNVMVNFLGLAQQRGVFTFDESAKIWECIKVFQRQS